MAATCRGKVKRLNSIEGYPDVVACSFNKWDELLFTVDIIVNALNKLDCLALCHACMATHEQHTSNDQRFLTGQQFKVFPILFYGRLSQYSSPLEGRNV